MLSTSNSDTSNLHLLKQVFFILVLICSVIQLFLSNNLREVVNLILLIISNLVAINYCFNEKTVVYDLKGIYNNKKYMRL